MTLDEDKDDEDDCQMTKAGNFDDLLMEADNRTDGADRYHGDT